MEDFINLMGVKYTTDLEFKELNKLYDVNTSIIICYIIDEILKYFPDIYTKEELKEIIKTNLKSNIEFKELQETQMGVYSYSKKRMAISNQIKDPRLSHVLLHEFMHLLINNNKIKEVFHEDGFKSYNEMMTSLLETKYYERKYGKKKLKLNNYIPDFIEQLYIIYGDDLFIKYLKNKGDIKELFNIKANSELEQIIIDNDKDKSKLMESFADNLYDFDKATEFKNYETLAFLNYKIEKFISMQLEFYLKNNNELTPKEKIEKTRKLLLAQKDPSGNVYYNIGKYLNEIKGDEKLMPDLESILDKEDKINEYKSLNIVKEVFGIEEGIETSIYTTNRNYKDGYSSTSMYEYYSNKDYYDTIAVAILKGLINPKEIEQPNEAIIIDGIPYKNRLFIKFSDSKVNLLMDFFSHNCLSYNLVTQKNSYIFNEYGIYIQDDEKYKESLYNDQTYYIKDEDRYHYRDEEANGLDLDYDVLGVKKIQLLYPKENKM